MLRPRVYITFTSSSGTSLSFDFANSVTTEESYEHLTDTAKIIVPRKLTMSGKNLFTGSNAMFKRKDKVKIEAGYYPNKYLLFEGYITNVGVNIPVEIDCEDNMFLLKQTNVTYPTTKDTAENVSLKDLVTAIVKGTGISVDSNLVDIKLGQASFSKKSPAQILDDLRSQFGLYSYCVGKTLFVGYSSESDDGKQAEFVMEEAVINSDSLQVQTADSIKKSIQTLSSGPDNQVVEGSAGDADGEVSTFHYYGITDKSELDKLAAQRLKQIKYDGLVGTIETFGEPMMHHGDRAKITSTKLPERNGIYVIKSVKRSFSVSGGYRQTLELGEKVA